MEVKNDLAQTWLDERIYITCTRCKTVINFRRDKRTWYYYIVSISIENPRVKYTSVYKFRAWEKVEEEFELEDNLLYNLTRR